MAAHPCNPITGEEVETGDSLGLAGQPTHQIGNLWLLKIRNLGGHPRLASDLYTQTTLTSTRTPPYPLKEKEIDVSVLARGNHQPIESRIPGRTGPGDAAGEGEVVLITSVGEGGCLLWVSLPC